MVLPNHPFWFVRLGPGLDTLWVPVDTWSAPPGDYAASVRVSYETQAGTVPVKVSLQAVPARLELAPREFEFRLRDGQATGLTNLLIHNAGEEQLHYEIASAPGWLRPSATSGDLQADSTRSILFALDARSLAPGTTTGSIDLDTNDPARPHLQIPVRLVRQGLVIASAAGSAASANPTAAPPATASVEPCPDDTFFDGYLGTLHSWADSLERASDPGGPPWSRWTLKYNRPRGLQRLFCMGSRMWLVNADRLQLKGGTPGLPFAFEVRLRYSLAADYMINDYVHYIYSGHCSVRLAIDDSVRIAEVQGGQSGGARTGSLVVLVAGYPEDFTHLEFSTDVRADGSNHGYATATASTSLSFRFYPADAGLASCRALPSTSVQAPGWGVAYAGTTDGLAVLLWNDCPPNHTYVVERDVAGSWMSVGTPVPDEQWRLLFAEPASTTNPSLSYRLVVDGRPGTVVRAQRPSDGQPSAVRSARAMWTTNRVTLRWETAVPGLPFACERRQAPDPAWQVCSEGTVPADGVLALTDSLVSPGDSYSYRLVFPALGALGTVDLAPPGLAPRFDVSPGALHYVYSVDELPSPIRVVLTNREDAAYDVQAEILASLPLRTPVASPVHLSPHGSATLVLDLNPNAGPGVYAGVLRLTAPAGSEDHPGQVTDLPLTLDVSTGAPRFHPDVLVYRSETAGWLEARARLVPGLPATARLFDALGRERESLEIATDVLVPLHLTFGRHARLPSGIYFVQITQGGQSAVGRGYLAR